MILKIIKFFFKNLNNHEKIKIFTTLILSFLNVILNLIQIFLIFFLILNVLNVNENLVKIKIFGNFFNELSFTNLIYLSFFFIFLNIFVNFFYIKQSFKQLNLFTSKLERIFFINFINRKYNFYKKKNSYEVVKTIVDNFPRLVMGIFYPLIQLFTNIVLFLTIFISLSFLNLKFTMMISLIFTSLVIIIYYFIKKKIIFFQTQESNAVTKRANQSLNAFNFFREIKIFNLFDKFIFNFDEESQKFYSNRSKTYLYTSFPKYILEYAVSSLILVFFLFINKSENIIELLPVISFYIMAVFRLLPCFTSTLGSISNIKSNYIYFDLIKNEIQNSIQENENVNFEEEKLNQEILKISIRDLNYKYRSNKIFKEFNFEILKKDKIFMSGETGSGKSTLLDIISGLNVSFDGQVIINDTTTLNYLTAKMIRDKISYCSQNPYLFEDTLKENIALFDPNFDEKKFSQVLNICKVNEIIEKKNINLKDNIAESGLNLSGGEKQRISLARSLYKNFDVLILDESTNSLNEKMEREIIENVILYCQEKTLIVCSHNLSLQELFNKKLEIKKI